jgi:quercetin dioxygenase-like cupin family protein
MKAFALRGIPVVVCSFILFACKEKGGDERKSAVEVKEPPAAKAAEPSAPAPIEKFLSQELYRADLQGAPGLEVIVSLVEIPGGMTLPMHTHPGEEFLYAIEGEAVILQKDKPEIVLKQGDVGHVPSEAVHSARANQPSRGIAFRVHAKGKPERTMVEQN